MQLPIKLLFYQILQRSVNTYYRRYNCTYSKGGLLVKQNIYDNPTFFESYKNLRDSGITYNDFIE